MWDSDVFGIGVTIDWRDWVDWGTDGTESSVEMNGAVLLDSDDDRIGDVSLGSSDSDDVMDPADLESPSSSDGALSSELSYESVALLAAPPAATPLGTSLRMAISATCCSSAPRQFWSRAPRGALLSNATLTLTSSTLVRLLRHRMGRRTQLPLTMTAPQTCRTLSPLSPDSGDRRDFVTIITMTFSSGNLSGVPDVTRRNQLFQPS